MIASESCHFYDREGNPQYTYINKQGKECKTTLTRAKKEGYLPSVTTITKLLAKPGLDKWRQIETIMACLTMPIIADEPEDEYIERIIQDSDSRSKEARDRGTDIHGYIERGFQGEILDGEANLYFRSVDKIIWDECGLQEWKAEKSFASSLGYGGKVDLHNDNFLIDFKGTDKPLDSIKTYPEQAMQLAAYDAGIDSCSRKCGICYVHRDTAESKLIWIDEKELMKGQEVFFKLLDIYYIQTGLIR